MNNNVNIKELISRFVDGEVTDQEKQLVEDALLSSKELQSFYKELVSLNALLNDMPDEQSSLDWELNLKKEIAVIRPKEETEMKFKKKFNYKFATTVATVILVVGVSIVSMQTYSQRSMQARVRDASLYMAQQTPAGQQMQAPSVQQATVKEQQKDSGATATAQYEPYYLGSNYTTERNAAVSKREAGLAQRTYSLGDSKDKMQAMPAAYEAATRSSSGGQISSYVPSETKEMLSLSRKKDDHYSTNMPYPSEPAKIINGFVSEAEIDSYKPNDSWRDNGDFNTENYDRIYENEFLSSVENPLSTFSIDVDTASYSNVRRFLNNNQMPQPDAVRIEEMVNYFSYDYPQPQGDDPFSINIDLAACPWNQDHKLARIGLKGKTLEAGSIPPSNLVFLIDVSGSMASSNKLPLLKTAYKMMVNQLSEKERVAIVVYAGAAGQVLESTPGSDKWKIQSAIDQLSSGGSTAGGAGIKLAYNIAKQNFIKGGNNRVILATDGDFNVGTSSDSELVRIIEEKREEGIFLTVLGFGMGNYKDGKMEKLADKGNGNYYYIDTEREAKKVLVSELGSTLFAIAKDVKLQIEFNPNQVKGYRLIGYENRILAKEDFNDDTKDAGELGAGHTVTALYEIIPADSNETVRKVDELKYQQAIKVSLNEMMTVKLRYKKPHENTSKLLSRTVTSDQIKENVTGDFQFAASVAEFGLILRNSKFKANSNYDNVLSMANASKGVDQFGYRQEFIDLVNKARSIDNRNYPQDDYRDPVFGTEQNTSTPVMMFK